MLARPAASTLADPYADDRAVRPPRRRPGRGGGLRPTGPRRAAHARTGRRPGGRGAPGDHPLGHLPAHGRRARARGVDGLAQLPRAASAGCTRSLVVRDARHVTSAEDMVAECVEHLRFATNGGRVRPTITVFPQAAPDGTGPRILGDQLIRYAGYRTPAGMVGDPSQLAATDRATALGWAGGRGSSFDVLPLIVQPADGAPVMAELPRGAVLEVELAHPD